MEHTNEQVPFKLIMTPCCGTHLCWINPRLPTYCPECGEQVLTRLREGHQFLADLTGWLRLPVLKMQEQIDGLRRARATTQP